MKKILILNFLIFINLPLLISKNHINWSSLETINGKTPGPDDIIVVHENDKLILDGAIQLDTIHVKGILIYGEFTAEDNNSNFILKSDWILVADSGSFVIGDTSNPFKSKFHLILSGNKGELFSLEAVTKKTINYISTDRNIINHKNASFSPEMLENMINVGTDPNNSFLMGMGNGVKIIMHNNEMETKKSWSQLNTTIKPGDTELILSDNVNWEEGDKLVIASTDFDLNQAETFTIIKVNSNQSVTINSPVKFMHYGEIENYSNNDNTKNWLLDMRAEVGLLNRNIKISGDVSYNPNLSMANQSDYYGGNIMAMMGAKMYISGIELEFMGQGGILGRYPTHWHMRREANGEYIKKSSIHHTYNKGITIHGTHNTLIEDNLIYENVGHSIFLEDGGENNNQIIHNLVINTRSSNPKNYHVADSKDDTETASFWMENANNIFRYNHSAGSELKGFWFDMRGLNGLSNQSSNKSHYSIYSSLEGPLLEDQYFGNVSHSNDVAFGLNHANLIMDETYIGSDNYPQNVNEFWKVKNLTCYKTTLAIWIRGIGGDFYDCKIGEMKRATRFRLNQSINNSLIVGRTKNIGNPKTEEEIKEGRSLPLIDTREGADETRLFTGHQLYDGPGGINGVHFAGFNGDKDFAIDESNAVHKSSRHYSKNISFSEDIKEINKVKFNNIIAEARCLIDIDGSLTGFPNSVLITKDRDLFYKTQNSILNSTWNAFLVQDQMFGSFKLRSDDFKSFNTTYSLKRIDKSTNDTVFLNNLEAWHSVRDQTLFPIDQKFKNEIEFENVPNQFEFYLNDIAFGQYVIYHIKGLPINSSFKIGFKGDEKIIEEVNSFSELDFQNTTSIFRDYLNNEIVIKFVAEMKHGFLFPQPKVSINNSIMGGVLVKFDNDISTFSEQNNKNKIFNLKVIPNPANNKIQVIYDLEKIKNVTIYSIDCKLFKYLQSNLDNIYDLNDLINGVYFLHFTTSSGLELNTKIIKN
jgi:hypothetical protein